MTFEEILRDLKQNRYQSIYFLMGDESYFIDRITDYITENALQESERDFNQTILYGKDVDIPTIITTARRFPMMANRQVVVVKEAQNIRNIEQLLTYVQNPLESTILVINYKYKSLDKRKSFTKEVAAKGVLFESKKIYENQIPDWIKKYLGSMGYKIEPKACILLSEFLGNDLSKITNELEKLMISIPKSETISAGHIERNIGISKDFNNFELHSALGKRDVLKANRIINYFAANQKNNPMVVTISLLHSYFAKVLTYHFLKNKTNEKLVASSLHVNPYFVKDYKLSAKNYTPKKLVEIISLLREYDLKSKGVGDVSSSQGELLKELVYRILH
ncbi:MAG: DNA polymerase III subunit delta [Marinifilaceae bacterium]